MSYINFTVLEKHGFEPVDFILLSAIKQTELEYLEKTLTDTHYNRFKELNLIKHIKAKRKDESLLVSLRLSQIGLDILKEIGRSPEIMEEDIQIKNWLISYYKSKGKQIGSEKRIEKYLVNFRTETGIRRNNLATLFKDFLLDDTVDESSKILESTLFQKTRRGVDKQGNIFYYEVQWDINDSWLYRHYLSKEDYFKNIFEED